MKHGWSWAPTGEGHETECPGMELAADSAVPHTRAPVTLYCEDLQQALKDRGVHSPSPQRLGAPAERISPSAFLHRLALNTFGLDALGFAQQIMPETNEKWDVGDLWNVHYYLFPASVYAVATKYSHGSALQPDEDWAENSGARRSREWGYRLRYYRMGCKHLDQQRARLAMHEYRITCPDCAYEQVFDSSD